jgi:hypothetical protein
LQLPFSHETFLDVFGAYNSALWPVAAVLWLATAVMLWQWIRQGRLHGRGVFALLAVHWAWSGIIYHWLYFRPVNPAATFFGAGFVGQAALFAWLAIASRGQVARGRSLRTILGGTLVFYGLVYPFLGVAFGLRYPRMPLFGVPCPTTLVTAGWLVTAAGTPRMIGILPLAWAVIGSSAAFRLGIRADFALTAAAVILAVDTVAPSALGARPVTT